MQAIFFGGSYKHSDITVFSQAGLPPRPHREGDGGKCVRAPRRHSRGHTATGGAGARTPDVCKTAGIDVCHPGQAFYAKTAVVFYFLFHMNLKKRGATVQKNCLRLQTSCLHPHLFRTFDVLFDFRTVRCRPRTVRIPGTYYFSRGNRLICKLLPLRAPLHRQSPAFSRILRK